MEFEISAPVNPTEEKAKVKKALENVFPFTEIKEEESLLHGSGDDKEGLLALKEHIRQQQIKETARAFFLGNLNGEKLSFSLNKQAAIMGKVNFVDFPISLGTIDVTIRDEKAEELISWLCED